MFFRRNEGLSCVLTDWFAGRADEGSEWRSETAERRYETE